MTLSEQQLLDCNFEKCDDCNKGCEGGFVQNALSYLQSNYLVDDRAYSYFSAVCLYTCYLISINCRYVVVNF